MHGPIYPIPQTMEGIGEGRNTIYIPFLSDSINGICLFHFGGTKPGHYLQTGSFPYIRVVE